MKDDAKGIQMFASHKTNDYLNQIVIGSGGRALGKSIAGMPSITARDSRQIGSNIRFSLMQFRPVVMEISKGVEVVAQGDRAEFCFEVVEGCLRTVKLLEDGRRQVGEFLLKGDIYGLDVFEGHEFTVETVTACTVRRSRAKIVDECIALNPVIAGSLRSYFAQQVSTIRGRLTVLGRLRASERIAAFLLEMSRRLGASFEVPLPMDRTDIADYLGLTIETVSRSLTDLRLQGAIAVKGSCITIQDPKALQAHCAIDSA